MKPRNTITHPSARPSAWQLTDGRVFDTTYALYIETGNVYQPDESPITGLFVAVVFDGERLYSLRDSTLGLFLQRHIDLRIVMYDAPFVLDIIDQAIRQKFDTYRLVVNNRIIDLAILHRLHIQATTGAVAPQLTLPECCLTHGIRVYEADIERSRRSKIIGFKRLTSIREASLGNIRVAPVAAVYALHERLCETLRSLPQQIIATKPVGFTDRSRFIRAWNTHGPFSHNIQLKAAIVLDDIARYVTLHVDRGAVIDLKDELWEEHEKIEEELQQHGYQSGRGSAPRIQGILRRLEKESRTLRFIRTKTGRIAVTAEHLEPFRDTIPFVNLFLRLKGIERLCCQVLDKIRYNYWSWVPFYYLCSKFDLSTNTGVDSMFGGIPARFLSQEQRLHRCFAAPKGHVLCIAKYRNIEAAATTYVTQSQFPYELQNYHDDTLLALLGLDAADYTKATGIPLDHHKSGRILGKTARQVFSNRSNDTTPEERDYVWSRLAAIADRLPIPFRRAVEQRKPSRRLAAAIRHQADLQSFQTTSGRIHAAMPSCIQQHTLIQGVIGDAVKLGLWELFRDGVHIVFFAYDTVVIQLPDESDHLQEMAEIKRLMIEGAQKIMPGVPIEVECRILHRWNEETAH